MNKSKGQKQDRTKGGQADGAGGEGSGDTGRKDGDQGGTADGAGGH